MEYSTIFTAVIVNLLSQWLPKIGVTVGTPELTSTVQLIIATITGVWVMYQRTTLKKALPGESDVTRLGIKK